MNQMKKILIAALLTCLLVLCTCCGGQKRPEHGKYYLEGSQEVYIEIIDDEYLQFVGVDFSFVDPETFWGEGNGLEPLDKDLDVGACMQGLKKYIFWRDNDITVELIERSGYGFAMQYDGNNTIRFHELNYVLG